MALILFGNGVADIRGSINGTTFARNKAGAYARNRTKPVNPNTVSQSANRNRFATQAAQWTALTNTEQDTWNFLAAGATRINRLGQPYTPSGRQLFLESANNMNLAGLPILTTAPANADIPAGWDATGIEAIITPGPPIVWNRVRFVGGSALGGMSVIVKATSPNPGPKTNFANIYRNIGTFSPVAALDVTTEYEAMFGTTPGIVGSPVSILVSVLDDATGFRSAELRLDTNVA